MKTIIAVIVGAAVGFAVGYVVLSKRSQAGEAVSGPSVARVAELEASLTNAQATVGRTLLNAPPYDLTPEQVLKRLTLIDPSSPEMRPRKIRQIIHHLEYLVDAGTNAFIPIRHYIATGEDVNYAFDDGRPGGPATFWNWRPGMELHSGLVLPPTLRIALVDVMRYIGGEDAEASLAWMLSGSARGMEIPYIAQALEKMAPGHYTQLAQEAAKNYLAAGGTNGQGQADAAASGYVYSWLGARGDTSVVSVANSAVLDASGKVNVEAARYLLNATKGGAMGELAKIYNNNADPGTKNAIATMAFEYVGSNDAADGVFKDWITGSDVEGAPGSINARPRELAIRLMAGGRYGPFNSPPPSDPTVIQHRVDILTQIEPGLNPRLKQAADQTIGSLKALPGAH